MKTMTRTSTHTHDRNSELGSMLHKLATMEDSVCRAVIGGMLASPKAKHDLYKTVLNIR